jgi:hypothetical protein
VPTFLFPDEILDTEVDREKNNPTGKKKRKMEKGSYVDIGKAVGSKIEGEGGFYMPIVCQKSFTSERIFS